MSQDSIDNDRWMRPAIWWLLFFAAPPVWLLLICLRHLPEIMGILAGLLIAATVFLVLAACIAALSGEGAMRIVDAPANTTIAIKQSQ